ncbi:MAG TPA: hypothetical protein VIF43_02705 [Patescibacteria group bacterium]|jgi:cytochrome bd-type quinol oxidase subunit 2
MMKPKLVLYYVAVAALLLIAAFSSLRLLNLDSVNYISIAQLYADGHWKEAVNGYWSPLFSWLLVPFVKLGIDGQVASRILMILFALGNLALGHRLVRKYAADKGTRAATIIYHLAMVPLLIVAVRGVITPDLLTVFFVLSLLTVLTGAARRKDRSRRTLVFIGLLAAAGYFAKAFLLPFFVVMGAAWFFALGEGGLTARFTDRLKRFGLVLAAFAITILPWVAALSLKYEHATTGNSGEYSLAYIGPNNVGHPGRNGLLSPPHDFSLGPMEDPSTHPYLPWSPLQSREDFEYYVDYLVNQNFEAVNRVLTTLSPYLLGVLLVLVGLLVAGKVDRRQRDFLTLIALMSLVYLSGYYALHVEGGGRYLWPVLVLSTLVTSIYAGTWYVRCQGRPRKILAILLIIALVFPAYRNLYVHDKERGYSEELSLYQAGQFVKERVEPRSRFASNVLRASTRISYYANQLSYGTTGQGVTLKDPGTLKALRDYGVEYFFYVDHPLLDNDEEGLSGFEVIGTTHVNFADHRSKFPGGPHKAYLIKL